MLQVMILDMPALPVRLLSCRITQEQSLLWSQIIEFGLQQRLVNFHLHTEIENLHLKTVDC